MTQEIHSRLSWRTANPVSRLHAGIMAGVVAVLSFLAAKLGGALVLRPEMLWPLWPGCAFLVAVLLLVSRRIWPILIAAGLAGFVLYDLQAGLTLRSIALLLLGDTLEVLIAVLGLSYAFDGPLHLDNIKALAKYSFFAVILSPLAGTFIATAAFGGNYWVRWRIGYFTEALALLTVTPSILSWASTRQAWIRKSRAFYFEGATLIAGLTLLGYVAFVAHARSSLPVLLYSLLPFLLWSALRFGMAGISTSMMVVAFLSIWGAVRGRGPFTGAEPLNDVISLQLFLFVAATTFMVLAVLVEEQKQAERALRESEERLRIAAEVGKMYAWEWDPATDSVLRSAEYADILGLSDPAGENIAKDYFSFVHPDDRAALWTLVDCLTPGDPVYRTQYRRYRSDGALLWLEESGCATFDRGGKMVRLVGMTADITERKRAEEALRSSEAREGARATELETVLEAVPVPVLIAHDVACRRITGNRAASEQLRVAAGENFSLSAASGERPAFRQMQNGVEIPADTLPMQRAAATGKPVYGREMTVVFADGTKREEVASAVPLLDEAGQPRGAVGVSIDLTELKQAETALRESELRFRAVYERSPIGIALADSRSGQFLRVNPKFCEITGRSKEELLRIDGESITHPQDIGQTGELLQQLSEEKLASYETEKRYLRPDGSVRWVRILAVPMWGKGETSRWHMSLVEDISERKRAEQALRESEEKYRELIENATYGIFRSNRTGDFLDVNRALVAMLGYSSKAELMTRNLDSDIYENPADRVSILSIFETRGRVDRADVNWKRKDGKTISVRTSGRQVRGKDGQVDHFEGIVEDTTERRSLEEQLRQANKMEAVGLLAGGISHDFNNLLNVILGNADLLLEKVESGRPQHYAEEIKKAAKRATQLTRQLLAFSRKQVLRPALLDLNAVVGEVAKILRHLIGEDVQIVVEGKTNLDSVWADPGQVEQILMNLATNARDAMPNGGMFTIRTDNAELGPADVARYPYVQPGRYVRLSASDTGLGMSPEVQSHAFEPFFTTKPQGRGTGLGLATVYGIVKQSGGYVWIHSELGAGTTFDIYLPHVDEAGSTLVGGLEVRSEYPKGTETILLLEDEESLREVTCEMLTAGGYSVLQAGRGDQAIELAQQSKRPIHLILSDVVLPDISGPSAVEAVQALHPETRVLFVSGYAEGSVAQKITKAGAILLQKPVSRSDLMRKVDEILHLRIPSSSTGELL